MRGLAFLSVMGVASVLLSGALPWRVAEPPTIEIGPGTFVVSTLEEHRIVKPVALTVPPVEEVEVRGERHESLPVFDPKAGGWRKGARLQRLITIECSATGLLHPETVVVKAGAEGEAYVLDKDYAMDPFWGTVGRLEGGAIPAESPVFIDYTYTPTRLDLVLYGEDGKVTLQKGEPTVGAIPPPVAPEGSHLLGTVWQSGEVAPLTEENLFPVVFEYEKEKGAPVAEALLPKTLAKLQAGEPVTYVAWGDSVTAGGGVDGQEEDWYQHQFVRRLRERFPQSEITVKTAAWPGAGSRQYLEAEPGGKYDFVRDVLEPKPDLVSIEFVNDAYLDEAGVAAHYGMILDRLQEAGAEVVLITPHLVRPDWMGVETLKFDEDPRPYVKGLKAIAKARGVALADASAEWCKLHRQGVPYMTRLSNSINHPDTAGHQIFADALMGLFP